FHGASSGDGIIDDEEGKQDHRQHDKCKKHGTLAALVSAETGVGYHLGRHTSLLKTAVTEPETVPGPPRIPPNTVEVDHETVQVPGVPEPLWGETETLKRAKRSPLQRFERT